MTVIQLYHHFHNRIPASLSCSWDNDGLMCAPDHEREVKAVLLALDITETVIDHAIEDGYDVIISHHPLVFRPVKNLSGMDHNSRKLMKLVSHGIAAMSFHTRLDALVGGVNDHLASIFGLCNVKDFGHEGEMIGRIGSLPEAMEFAAFAKMVKEKLSAPYVNCVDCKRPVLQVALVGGDGKDFMTDAYFAGADVYLTGTISYNMMADASELGLGIVEAGHFHTEQPVLAFFDLSLREMDKNLRIDSMNSNPAVAF